MLESGQLLTAVLGQLRAGSRLDQVAEEHSVTTRELRRLFARYGLTKSDVSRLRSRKMSAALFASRLDAITSAARPDRRTARKALRAADRLAEEAALAGRVAEQLKAEHQDAPERVKAALHRVRRRAEETAIEGAELVAAHRQAAGSTSEGSGSVHSQLNGIRRGRRKKWTDDELIAVLKNAGTMEFPLTADKYEGLRQQRLVDGPSYVLICSRLGSWAIACGLAGVECGATRHKYAGRWTDGELSDAVRQYLEKSPDGTYAKYDEWARDHDAPSGQTICNRLGSWSAAKQQASGANGGGFGS